MRSNIVFEYDCVEQVQQAAALDELIRQERFGEVIQYFADDFVVESDRDDVYLPSSDYKIVREAAYYYAAWLQVVGRRDDLAVEYISQIPAAISKDVGLCGYSFFREDTSMLYDQLKTLNGKPVFIVAMPKSASSFISSIMSSLTNMPIVRTTFGQFPKLVVVPRWINNLREFGGVTHDHVLPTRWTLECIVSAGITDIFVQYRDPRAAAWSACMQNPELPMTERFLSHLKWFNEWLVGWLEIRDLGMSFRLHFLGYDEIRNKPKQVFRSILDATDYTIKPGVLDATLDRAFSEMHRYNFRSGNPDEWKHMVPPDTIALSNALLDPRVKMFLGESHSF